MEYKSDKPIYLQIADHICDQIMQGVWGADERIPSVRELSASLEVNPNTVVRSFENIEQQGIIYNKRGLGYFVSMEAKDKISQLYKEEFFKETLPDLFKRMDLLGVDINDLTEAYKKYQK